MINFEPEATANGKHPERQLDDRKRRPKTSELEVLVALARAGSFGGAAVELGCTQSRISHALGAIEEALGVRLFDRSRTGTRPTDAGTLVIAKARDALELLDSIAATSDSKALRGAVRIAAYRSVATHLLTPIANALAKVHPALRLEIDDRCDEREDVERLVRTGQADLGVVHRPVAGGFTVTPFVEDDYVLVVPNRHAPREGSLWLDLEKLALLELRCSGARGAVETCRQLGLTNRTVATFSSDSTILAQVATRPGFSILSRLVVEPLPKGLLALPLPVPAPRALVVIRRSDRRGSLLRGVTASLRAALRSPIFEGHPWIRVALPGNASEPSKVMWTTCR